MSGVLNIILTEHAFSSILYLVFAGILSVFLVVSIVSIAPGEENVKIKDYKKE